MDHAPADAGAVAQVADHQGGQLHSQDAVAQGVEGSPVVAALSVKEEEDAAAEVPQHRRPEEGGEDRHQGHGPAETSAVIDVLQDEGEEVGGHGRAHEDGDEEVEAVEEQVEPQGHRQGVVDGEHAQGVEEDGAHGEPEAELVHAPAAGGRLPLAVVGEHQQHQEDGGEQLRRKGPPYHVFTFSLECGIMRLFYHNLVEMNRKK